MAETTGNREQAAARLNAPPTLGAYIKVRRKGDGPLSDVLFDAAVRGGITPPAWQKKLHDQIVDEVTKVLSSDLSVDSQRMCCEWYSAVFTAACVKLPASSRAPAQASGYAASIKKFSEVFVGELDARIDELLDKNLYYAAGAVGLLGIVGTAFVTGTFVGESLKLGNYLLAGAGAATAVGFSDFLTKSIGSWKEYVKRTRQLRRPLARVMFACVLGVVAVMCVSTGVVSLKVGQWKSEDISSQTAVALLFGFLSGMPGSFLSKRIFSLIGARRDVRAHSNDAG